MYDELKDGVATSRPAAKRSVQPLATEARKTLEAFGVVKEEPAPPKLSKEEQEQAEEAFESFGSSAKARRAIKS